MDTAHPWKLNIVGYGTVPVDQILANEKNYRIHSRAQQEALACALGDVGIIQNCIVNRRTSDAWPVGERGVETLIDGACRVMLALRHGQPTLPVTYVDLEPAQEYAALATLDTITALAGVDSALFQALVEDVRDTTTNATLVNFLTSMAEEHATEAPPTAQEARSAREVCCPECGCLFTPTARVGGHRGGV